jgi:hypothetical protein
VNYQQDNWLDLLSQAEFAYNNITHASTGISPFFANYGFHPRFSLEILGDSVNPSAEERATRLGQVQQNLMAELKLTQEWQKKQADRRRKDHPNFKVGDKVWLLRKKHCYHSPMCQVGLQTPRTFQNRQIGWSSGLPVGASTLVQNPQCFPCLLA